MPLPCKTVSWVDDRIGHCDVLFHCYLTLELVEDLLRIDKEKEIQYVIC